MRRLVGVVVSVRVDVGSLGALSQLGTGGQGVVYSTPLRLSQLALPLVFKKYKPQVVGGLDVRVASFGRASLWRMLVL